MCTHCPRNRRSNSPESCYPATSEGRHIWVVKLKAKAKSKGPGKKSPAENKSNRTNVHDFTSKMK